MKYLISIIVLTYLAIAFSLKCDSYYQYQVGGFQAQSLDHIISGCDACGYLYSNITDFNNFRGFFSGCLFTAKTLAKKYDGKVFNMTEFSTTCDKNNKDGIPYCQQIISTDDGHTMFDSKICCCSTDTCTRPYFQKTKQ